MLLTLRDIRKKKGFTQQELAAADVARCNAVDNQANMDAIRNAAIDLLKLLARPVGLEPTTVGLEENILDVSSGETVDDAPENAPNDDVS